MFCYSAFFEEERGKKKKVFPGHLRGDKGAMCGYVEYDRICPQPEYVLVDCSRNRWKKILKT